MTDEACCPLARCRRPVRCCLLDAAQAAAPAPSARPPTRRPPCRPCPQADQQAAAQLVAYLDAAVQQSQDALTRLLQVRGAPAAPCLASPCSTACSCPAGAPASPLPPGSARRAPRPPSSQPAPPHRPARLPACPAAPPQVLSYATKYKITFDRKSALEEAEEAETYIEAAAKNLLLAQQYCQELPLQACAAKQGQRQEDFGADQVGPGGGACCCWGSSLASPAARCQACLLVPRSCQVAAVRPG
jgi:hypothetical protein